MNRKFSKCERLAKRNEFKKVFENGRIQRKDGINFYVLINDEQECSRLGIVAKKVFGNSVNRNRVKRLFREAFRKNKDLLVKNVDIVAVPRLKMSEFSFTFVETSLIKLFEQIKK